MKLAKKNYITFCLNLFILFPIVIGLLGCNANDNSAESQPETVTPISAEAGNFSGRIVFHIFDRMYPNGPLSPTEESTIYQINADAEGEPEEIDHTGEFKTMVKFSPSGDYLAYINKDSHVKIIDKEGASICESPHCGDFCWYGDDYLIIPKEENIFLLDIINKEERKIYTDEGNAYFLNYSPLVSNQNLYFAHFESKQDNGQTTIASFPVFSAGATSFDYCNRHWLDFGYHDFPCLALMGNNNFFSLRAISCILWIYPNLLPSSRQIP